jgi:protein ImuB
MFVKPLALSFGEVQRSPGTTPDAPAREEQLWIAVYQSNLSMQAIEPQAAARRDSRPTVVVEPLGGRLRVIALNDAARSRGVRPGLDLNAAFAFSGALRVLERSHSAEQDLLEACAAVCHRFTPSVSLEPPESLLLEVRASLTLFGGIELLKAALGAALVPVAASFRLSIAPTPLAALWLARGEGGDAASHAALIPRLSRLSLSVTRWSDPVLDLLEGMGIATIGDCLRLPRDGFARRVGVLHLEEIDKALGKRPDLRAGFEAPQHLGFEVELADECTSLPIFTDAVTRMVEHLASELRVRQSQIAKMQLSFLHRRAAPTVYRLELLDSTCDRQRLLELVCDKLERIELPAPATALRLAAGPLESAILNTGHLFKGEGEAAGGGEARARLVERLRGRLGQSAVRGLAPAADHRPERAWLATDAPQALRRQARNDRGMAEWERTFAPGERPLWLAPVPEPLHCVEGQPRLGGPLRVLEGPERIESGWWNGEGIARDYYVALGPEGERLWIFRDRADRRWYLQGRFG